MDKAKIIDVIKLHRRFSICALANKYNFSNADVQAVVNELLDKGVLVQDSEVKLKYIEKSETFCAIFEMLSKLYKNVDISESDIEMLAWNLEFEIESGDINGVPNAVLNFWSELLWCKEHGMETDDVAFDDSIDFDEILSYEVDSDLAKDLDIFEEIIDILEVNEKNAHTLYQSFLDFNDYNAFARLMTDFRHYFNKSELDEIFEAASCFDKQLVDCYRDD